MHITFVEAEFGWQLVEKWVTQTLGQRDPAARLVLQHAADQIKQGQMFGVVHDDIAVQRLAVLFDVSRC